MATAQLICAFVFGFAKKTAFLMMRLITEQPQSLRRIPVLILSKKLLDSNFTAKKKKRKERKKKLNTRRACNGVDFLSTYRYYQKYRSVAMLLWGSKW